MKLAEFCHRVGAPYRDTRYVLGRGVATDPGRGEHRDLDSAQAFWQAIVLKLKASGVKVPVAARVADFAQIGVRQLTEVNLGRDVTAERREVGGGVTAQ